MFWGSADEVALCLADSQVDGPLVTAMLQGSWVLLSHAEQAQVSQSPLQTSGLMALHEAAPAVLDRLNSLLEPNGFLLPTSWRSVVPCGHVADRAVCF